ncbi:hypothetical protein VSU19_22930 [Verrucomicrobiales bacterium BCK34]|nr:hypothetical protein [Verrucomicrobiales bacterium BCK34]
MNSNLSATAVLRRVGQGFFYTCEVNCPQNADPIRFVYDCGAKTNKKYLEAAVEAFVEELHGESLNFFVVSHYDEDHVNGLNALLSRGVHIKKVFLPYLTPLQRMLQGFSAPSFSGWYADFIDNPVSYLTERGVEEVILVIGSGNDPRDDNQDSGPPFLDGPLGQPNDFPTDLKPESPRRLPDEFGEGERAVETDDANVIAISDRGRVHAGLCWQLKFFNYDRFPPETEILISRAAIASDTSTDRRIQRWKKFVSDLLDILDKDTLSPLELLTAIRTESVRLAVKEAHKTIRADHNDISMTLWHGPSHSIRMWSHISGRDELRMIAGGANQTNGWWPSGGGTLLTGDLGVKKRVIFSEFRDHYDGYFDSTEFAQTPHHGSRASWNRGILDLLPTQSAFFLSAGIGNTYGHPNLDVLVDISNSGRPCYWGHTHCEVVMQLTT